MKPYEIYTGGLVVGAATPLNLGHIETPKYWGAPFIMPVIMPEQREIYDNGVKAYLPPMQRPPVFLRVKKLHPDAKLPVYATAEAAGADLFAYIGEGKLIQIDPGERVLISAGVAVALDPGWEIQIRPRSGLALKKGITILNSPGTIDSDYRGAIGAILINTSDMPFVVEHGDRIAQMVIAPVHQAFFHEVEELDSTSRGAGAFGSTGAK